MDTIKLYKFQQKAADQIAHRFAKLLEDDENRPMEKKRWATPYYQALSALTGAGKTPILADAVAQMRALLPIEPLVLWISKARVVVSQTLKNLGGGGKYAHLVEGFIVKPLLSLTPAELADGSTPLIALATSGLFNVAERSKVARKVHKQNEDRWGASSTWSGVVTP